MVKQITLTDKKEFSCEIYCDGKLIKTSKNRKHHEFTVGQTPAKFKIYTKPYKIQPFIRFDGHFVNYGLAKIKPWDHMLEFEISKDYLQDYFKQIILAKKKYLSSSGQDVPINMENYVGINNENTELVSEIKDLIK